MNYWMMAAFIGTFSLGYLVGEVFGINKGIAQQMLIQKKAEASAAFQATMKKMMEDKDEKD